MNIITGISDMNLYFEIVLFIISNVSSKTYDIRQNSENAITLLSSHLSYKKSLIKLAQLHDLLDCIHDRKITI